MRGVIFACLIGLAGAASLSACQSTTTGSIGRPGLENCGASSFHCDSGASGPTAR